MITYKKHSSYKSMPWKNGGGVTSQIAIHPETANFPDDDFLWRLSSAKISAKNNFSQFNGYDRVLFVISGEGLLLNNFKLLPLTAFSFKGETPIECQLINDEVIDLGIIYKRGKVKVETSVLTLSVATATEVHKLSLLFCAKGRCKVEAEAQTTQSEVKLEPMDTLEVTKQQKLKIVAIEPTILIRITISEF